MTVVATRAPDRSTTTRTPDGPAVPRTSVTVITAKVVETRGLLARIAVQLNPYDVRELSLNLDTGILRVVVGGAGFDAGRVAARLDKIIGVLELHHS
jgi:ABC-type uncharacterized transport system ATPase subunit